MVSTSGMTSIPDKQLHLNVLPLATQEAFFAIRVVDFLPCNQWYLAGGTALALQVGHRESVDLDFFTLQNSFDETNLERHLMNTSFWVTTSRDEGTLYGELKGAKMSFIAYPFFQPSATVQSGTICVLQPADIAVMKIIAISQRGKKRDFIDLYWYACNREPLLPVIERVTHSYPGQQHNVPHFLKSLVYFADAEADPMPNLFFKADWKTTRAYFEKEIPKIARELLKLD
ncbi:MAG: nucleotidyl transferase AbiEii/AbiGii toxin family protein [Patescibacteria group bacterium]